ncbi:unnamed protein product [Arctia plantaginis]|uniref:Uncharacterized protein n=1 Tax=Arctia plantaginis TaxID=874455 RepID=A0A8S1A323_ARCPL|nr:unnamed protein product [Arctia plantaginis]
MAYKKKFTLCAREINNSKLNNNTGKNERKDACGTERAPAGRWRCGGASGASRWAADQRTRTLRMDCKSLIKTCVTRPVSVKLNLNWRSHEFRKNFVDEVSRADLPEFYSVQFISLCQRGIR